MSGGPANTGVAAVTIARTSPVRRERELMNIDNLLLLRRRPGERVLR
jgi:hypothetical protein